MSIPNSAEQNQALGNLLLCILIPKQNIIIYLSIYLTSYLSKYLSSIHISSIYLVAIYLNKTKDRWTFFCVHILIPKQNIIIYLCIYLTSYLSNILSSIHISSIFLVAIYLNKTKPWGTFFCVYWFLNRILLSIFLTSYLSNNLSSIYISSIYLVAIYLNKTKDR